MPESNAKNTFMVQIHFQQNSTWQGTITWTDKKKSQNFRSTLEMIKLMDDAIAESASNQEDESKSQWQ